jgi:3-deoxy-D-manno-octulosonate 8-phosphate phosphatase (KDO 8-P phosphatase)
VRPRRAFSRRARPRGGAAIRLLVLDVDGVLTDGRLWFGPRGELLKVFHVRDGHGIRAALAAGIEIVVLSGRRSAAVVRRCRELGIRQVFQGIADKRAVFERVRRRLRLAPAECACIGDDEPDVPVMRAVGLAFAVADAHASALAVAHRVTLHAGGAGAVREVCDQLLASRGARA